MAKGLNRIRSILRFVPVMLICSSIHVERTTWWERRGGYGGVSLNSGKCKLDKTNPNSDTYKCQHNLLSIVPLFYSFFQIHSDIPRPLKCPRVGGRRDIGKQTEFVVCLRRHRRGRYCSKSDEIAVANERQRHPPHSDNLIISTMGDLALPNSIVRWTVGEESGWFG